MSRMYENVKRCPLRDDWVKCSEAWGQGKRECEAHLRGISCTRYHELVEEVDA